MAASCQRIWNGSPTSFPAISGWRAEKGTDDSQFVHVNGSQTPATCRAAISAAGRKTNGGEDCRPTTNHLERIGRINPLAATWRVCYLICNCQSGSDQ